MSLKAIATPAARDPGPSVTRLRNLTQAHVDSIGSRPAKTAARFDID